MMKISVRMVLEQFEHIVMRRNKLISQVTYSTAEVDRQSFGMVRVKGKGDGHVNSTKLSNMLVTPWNNYAVDTVTQVSTV
jgi:hypothetical protein